MDPGTPSPHPEEGWKNEAARHSNMVGQIIAGRGPLHFGSVLRTAILRPFTRFPTRTRVPLRLAANQAGVARDQMVHRG